MKGSSGMTTCTVKGPRPGLMASATKDRSITECPLARCLQTPAQGALRDRAGFGSAGRVALAALVERAFVALVVVEQMCSAVIEICAAVGFVHVS